MGSEHSDITGLLARLQHGDQQAWEPLLQQVYGELRELAHVQLGKESGDCMLDTTALVHEAYLRLASCEALNLERRAHFFGAAARAMRRILVEEARRQRALKRGGEGARLSVTGLGSRLGDGPASEPLEEIEALDRALTSMAEHRHHARKARVVELRYFGGLSVEETGDVLEISPATVKRDWEFARVWLSREISRRP